MLELEENPSIEGGPRPPGDVVSKSVRGLVILRKLRHASGAISLCAIALCACVLFAAAGSGTALAASPSTITLTADKSHADAGETVTFTAVVTNPDGNPTGKVKLSNGGVFVGDSSGYALVPVPGSSTQSVATIQTSFASGSYDITAAYYPKSFPMASSSPVHLTIGHVDLHLTTLTLTADPTTVVPGAPVTLTATVAEVSGSNIPSGIVSFDDNGIPFPDGEVLLDANGRATLTVDGFQSGPHVIHASYLGTAVDAGSSASLDLNVPEVATAVDTTIDVTVDPPFIHEGDSVTIVAHVQQVGRPTSPPAGAIVTFTANGVPLDPGSAELDENGNATLVVSGGWQTGVDYVIEASYVGDASNNPSTGDGFLSVLPGDQPLTVPTNLAYTGATSGAYGTTVQLSAVLTSGAGAVAGEPVTLTLGTQSCPATTDANGLASCTITLAQSPGNYTVQASFAGDGLLLASGDSQPFVIGREATTLTYTGGTSADYGDATTLAATLRDASGAGLPGKSVTLTLGSISCTVTTGPGGVASCPVAHVTLTPGSYTATASFAGDATYLSAPNATAAFQVRREPTAAAVSAVGAVAAGSVQLRGTLTEDGLPLAGATVTLSLGAATCTGVTNASGVATCPVTAATLGPASVGISYAGDANYVGSSASIAGGALVYGFAAGTGSFVIGDGNAATGTAVTFWGAQWAKLNKVSGGAAPDAFKGYAAQGTRTCNGAWTTGPGNSTSPPAGALPAYMAVLVTSAVGKSGSAISGTATHIVVVKTDGGYKNDPGHAGTGTVVATVC